MQRRCPWPSSYLRTAPVLQVLSTSARRLRQPWCRPPPVYFALPAASSSSTFAVRDDTITTLPAGSFKSSRHSLSTAKTGLGGKPQNLFRRSTRQQVVVVPVVEHTSSMSATTTATCTACARMTGLDDFVALNSVRAIDDVSARPPFRVAAQKVNMAW